MKCSVQRLFGEQGRKRRADIGWIVDRRAASFPCANVGDWCLRCTEPETIYLIQVPSRVQIPHVSFARIQLQSFCLESAELFRLGRCDNGDPDRTVKVRIERQGIASSRNSVSLIVGIEQSECFARNVCVVSFLQEP